MADRDELRALGKALERALEANRRAFERQASSFARQEIAFERLMAKLDRRDAESERFEERMRRSEAETARILERVVSTLADLADQVRANTQATLRMLDRLGPAPGQS